jgi:hypothetical protein
MKAFYFALAALFPLAAGAAPLDLAHCQKILDFERPVWSMGPDGRIVANPGYKGIRSLTHGKDQDRLVYTEKDPFHPEGPARAVTVVLQKDSTGKPYRVTVKRFDALAARYELAYEGNRCAVDQALQDRTSQHGKKEPSLVDFDRRLCNELLVAIQNMGEKKLAECEGLLGRLDKIIDRHRERVTADGGLLNMDNITPEAYEYHPGKDVPNPQKSPNELTQALLAGGRCDFYMKWMQESPKKLPPSPYDAGEPDYGESDGGTSQAR